MANELRSKNYIEIFGLRKNVRNSVNTSIFPTLTTPKDINEIKYHFDFDLFVEFTRWLKCSITWIWISMEHSYTREAHNRCTTTGCELTAVKRLDCYTIESKYGPQPHTGTHIACAGARRASERRNTVLSFWTFEGEIEWNFRFLRTCMNLKCAEKKTPHAAATAATDNEFECRSTRHMQKSIGECINGNRSHPIGVGHNFATALFVRNSTGTEYWSAS